MIAAFGGGIWDSLAPHLRVMLQTRWSAEARLVVRVEFRRALALRSEIRRAGGRTTSSGSVYSSLHGGPSETQRARLQPRGSGRRRCPSVLGSASPSVARPPVRPAL